MVSTWACLILGLACNKCSTHEIGIKRGGRGGRDIFFVTAPGSYFNSLAQIFFVSSALSLSHASKILQNKLISTKGKREGKIRVIFIFVLNFLIALNWY